MSSLTMISIIDCGMGNLGSVVNMLKYIGVDSRIIKTSAEVMDSEKLIFPGVGHWDNGVKKIQDSGIQESLNQQVVDGKVPFLGICLGMQLLFDTSEEGEFPGLGWIAGSVKKFAFDKPVDKERKLHVPHMGWNLVKSKQLTSLNTSLGEEPRFYFVHSYFANCNEEEDVLMTCHYGNDFTCAVNKKNIWGVQFHPEKSHKYGIQLMKNFAEL